MLNDNQIEVCKSYKLSENFTLYELIKSESHPELVIFPPEQIIQELTKFCNQVLQPIRAKWGRLQINSGWRNTRLNSAIGGEKNSVHKILSGPKFLGVASDVVPIEADILEVYEWIIPNVPAARCTIIYRNSSVTKNPFIHVDSGVFRPDRVQLEKTSPGKYVFYSKE